MYTIIFAIIIMIFLIWCAYGWASKNNNIFTGSYYYDASGTTPINKKALDAYVKYSYLGNASAIYGTKAKTVIRAAADTLLAWCNSPHVSCDTHNVIFNSGASEGNNHVLRMFAGRHIVISETEHKTSILCAKWLSEHGTAVTWLKPNIHGEITLENVLANIRPDTALVSVVAVCEIGARNDMRAIAGALQKRNIILHCDVVQLIGKERIDWSPDIITGSFHKLHGPAGLGFIVYDRRLTDLFQQSPHIFGTQFDGCRGGTENVPAIAAANVAMHETWKDRSAKNLAMAKKKQSILRSLKGAFHTLSLEDFILPQSGRDHMDDFTWPLSADQSPEIFMVVLTDSSDGGKHEMPGVLSVSFIKTGPIENKFCNLILRQDMLADNAIIGIGSACSTTSKDPNSILVSMGLCHILRAGYVRISLHDDIGDWNAHNFAKILIANVRRQLQILPNPDKN